MDAVPVGRPPARSGRTRIPAPERIPSRSLTDTASCYALLTEGTLTVLGLVGGASNAVLHCTVAHEGEERTCAYKPVAGEQPLWDFPGRDARAQREVAAYEISRATGWDLVPPTVLRDGPYGEGMCQLWIDGPDPTEGEQALLALVEDDEPGEGWKAVGFADVERTRCSPTPSSASPAGGPRSRAPTGGRPTRWSRRSARPSPTTWTRPRRSPRWTAGPAAECRGRCGRGGTRPRLPYRRRPSTAPRSTPCPSS
ncbi:hypothetical protein SMICM17S_11834 [Streptomyces microflavus]